MAKGEGLAVAAFGGIGCVWILGVLATLGFWGLVFLALAKFVFGWTPF